MRPLATAGVVLCVSSAAAGCASPAAPPRAAAAASEATPRIPAVSYDWHPLILMPFGTLLKESPLPLHEVLLFNGTAPEGASNEGKDCFAAAGAAPQFAGRGVDDYMLCFEHDRLKRIEASVRLPADAGAAMYARLCAQWLKDAALPPTQAPCEGRDGPTGFSAHLGGDAAQSSTTLSISLFSVDEP